jgi:hypothetical protein
MMPESRVGAMLLVAGAAVTGLLILRLQQANRRLKASQKEVHVTFNGKGFRRLTSKTDLCLIFSCSGAALEG